MTGIQLRALTIINLFFFWLIFTPEVSAQLPAQVVVYGDQHDTTVVIGIQWSGEAEKIWRETNADKLEIPSIKVDIQSGGLKKSSTGYTAYSFSFEREALVELFISISELAMGEKLYLADKKTGDLFFDFAKQNNDRFLTPEFNPDSTVLIWACAESSSYKSDFEIHNVYLQPLPSRSVLDIGFGTSFVCHPNAVCKEDSILQLISASAVRIRLVMEEGIGWCTGSFINNTRNDKTPYLLTAFHCQYDFTPLYDMWRFDFQYSSPTCVTPGQEPTYFSLTGCDLISGGQASDFLLVRLEDQIPANQEVTFAGWDHDDSITPDTSYLIHHPNADIRKISTCTTKAVIHPNQIGWSEGYTTPANHHFRFKFTEGGHEAGSSGGPLFNEEGYLVGQLHGGSAGCEITNNAFVGRLSKSWNTGATVEQRLVDWLDPDDTGLTQLPSLENMGPADLVDIKGIVLDPKGNPVKNVIIKVTGSAVATLVTGDDGAFELNGVSRVGPYFITPAKNINQTNGLNAVDLISIQKHLLGKDTFDFPWQFIAGDASSNDQLSAGDIVLLLKLLLGKIQSIPSTPSWSFDPAQMIVDPIVPGGPIELQFMGIKTGDVNASADPKL